MHKKRLLGTAAYFSMTLASLVAAPAAFGQEQAATSEREDVVVVTALRREQDVQDAPINIAAVGGEQIEEQGFTELSDLLSYVPGINVVDRGGRQGNPIIVRGLNADPDRPGRRER